MLVLLFALLLGVVGARAEDADRIDAPTNGDHVAGQVEVRGRAVGRDPSRFSFYRLHYGPGPAPSVLRPIGPPVDQPVDSGPLGVWDTATLSPGDYTLQLTVYDTGGSTNVIRIVVTVDPAPRPTRSGTQPPLVFATPGEAPTPGAAPEAAPAQPPPPPPQDTSVRPVDVPPPSPRQPITLPDAPPPGVPPPPPLAPIPSDPIRQPSLPPPLGPINTDPIARPTSSFDPGPSGPAPITLPPPPAAPVLPPYEPPPLPTFPVPTPFGNPL